MHEQIAPGRRFFPKADGVDPMPGKALSSSTGQLCYPIRAMLL